WGETGAPCGARMRPLVVPRQRSGPRRMAGRRPTDAAGRGRGADPRRVAAARPHRAAALGRAARRGDPRRDGAAAAVWAYRHDGIAAGAAGGMAADRRMAARAP